MSRIRDHLAAAVSARGVSGYSYTGGSGTGALSKSLYPGE
ncbi:hypothetical protein ASZ90_015030 [hydrocarbon metagenome]|uniref:Uncharacterized protein n=1 Tax=hydrocarbon metagenome TaxID=938273 RepID=A0A0W8F3B4_9ZZZZ